MLKTSLTKAVSDRLMITYWSGDLTCVFAFHIGRNCEKSPDRKRVFLKAVRISSHWSWNSEIESNQPANDKGTLFGPNFERRPRIQGELKHFLDQRWHFTKQQHDWQWLWATDEHATADATPTVAPAADDKPRAFRGAILRSQAAQGLECDAHL